MGVPDVPLSNDVPLSVGSSTSMTTMSRQSDVGRATNPSDSSRVVRDALMLICRYVHTGVTPTHRYIHTNMAILIHRYIAKQYTDLLLIRQYIEMHTLLIPIHL